MAIQCPICQSDSSIKKVSSVVSEGVITINSYYVKGTTTTEIVHLLSAPQKPSSFPNTLIFGWFTFTTIICLLIMTVFCTMFVPVSIVNSIVVLFADSNLSNSYRIIIVIGFVLFLLLSILGVIIGILGIYFVSNKFFNRKSNSQNYYQNVLLPTWQAKYDLWDRLYYCWKDDAVFDPKNYEYFRPTEMNKYLQESSKIEI